MQRPYLRRAVLVCAFAALQPAASTSARALGKDDPESLWEALTHVTPTTAGLTPLQQSRRPLGAVPGFTVPVPASARLAQPEDFFNQKKRHSRLGAIGDWIGRMQAATGTNVNLKGSMNFSYRLENVSGGADASTSYHSDQYYGNGSNGLYNLTQVDVDATFLKHFHYKNNGQ